MKIAVLTLSRMGDILLTGPMIDRLHELHHGCEIHLIVPKTFVSVGEGLNVEHVHALDTDSLIRSSAKNPPLIEYYLQVVHELSDLRAIPFDLNYNLGYDTVSATVSHLMHGDVVAGQFFDEHGNRRIAGDWARMAMTSHLARGLNPFHLADLQLGMTGKRDNTIPPMNYSIPDDARARAQSMLRSLGANDNSAPTVVMQVGASHPSKRWDAQSFGIVARELNEKHGIFTMFTGTANENQLIQEAVQIAGSSAINLAGKTDIPILAAILEQASLVISNDTGTMHLAQAVGTPVLCLTTGNALSQETGPYGDGNLIVEPDIDCFPCNFEVQCPHLNCHGHIDPALVTRLALDMLGNTVPDRYELSAPVRITRTYFDEDGFWNTRLLHGRTKRFDPLREAYRVLLKARFVGEKADASLIHDLHLVEWESAKNLLELANTGLAATNALQDLVSDTSDTDQLQRLARQIDEVQDKVLSDFLHAHELHPLLALFRFELENTSGENPESRVEATQKAFSRLIDSLHGITGAHRKTSEVHQEVQQESHQLTNDTSFVDDGIVSPYARFARPRFRDERATVLLLESEYYLQSEIRNALQRLGHHIISLRYLESGNVIEQLLMASLEADVLMTVNHLGFDQDGELASLLEKIKLPYVSWFADRPQYILLDHQAAAGEMAHIFTWEHNTIKELNEYGFQRVNYLPLATDETAFVVSNAQVGPLHGPRWVANSMVEPVREWEGRAKVRSSHEPVLRMAVQELLDKRCDPWDALNVAVQQFPVITQDWTQGDKLRFTTLVALRATREDRKRIAQATLTYGLEIVGEEGWSKSIPGIRALDQIDYGPGLAQYYANSIQLNSTSYQMPTSVNQRVFDVPCASGVLLTDDQADLHELFDAEHECFTYRTPDEAVEKIQYLKDNPDSARRVSNLARTRILAEHTYKQRLETIIDSVREAHKPAIRVERRA